jgi:hypothetical protein
MNYMQILTDVGFKDKKVESGSMLSQELKRKNFSF